MAAQYSCKNQKRREALLQAKKLNGIDYVEIGSADQLTLQVFFLFPIPGEVDPLPPAPSSLTAANFAVQGGVRIRNIAVTSATPGTGELANMVTLTVDRAGDFSTYTLVLLESPTVSDPPAGFDPQMSSVGFSFKVACSTGFDCASTTQCPPVTYVEPEINYLAKDYDSFRTLMLNRLSVLLPGGNTPNPADEQTTLVEMLAYVGDQLSYYQDAVATEAYLGTARRRVSVRRHTRLLNYHLHDGVNARTFVAFQVDAASFADGKTLPAHTQLLTGNPGDTALIRTAQSAAALASAPILFETMAPLQLASANNRIAFYTWNDTGCCLPLGATEATLRALPGAPEPTLSAGDLLLFEEIISPITGSPADADPSHRQVVRLTSVSQGTVDPLDGKPIYNIAWYAEDALTFSLCLDAGASGVAVSVARGNIVLADAGATQTGQQLNPPQVTAGVLYRPQLPQTNVTNWVPYDDELATQQPASALLLQDPRAALPSVTLNDGNELWSPQLDLLSSSRTAPDFVVETETDGTATLRFGDNILGRAPAVGIEFQATFRTGNGSLDNVGAGALSRVIADLPGISLVRNPLAALGGTDPEPIDEARQFAPQAFRQQQRAVTAADYAAVAQKHPEVQKAAASFRWTGSWYTVFVTIDRTGGQDVESDTTFKQQIRSFIEPYRMAGYDLEINGPVYAPIDLALSVCVADGYFQANVKQQLLQALSANRTGSGQTGFFYPDNFSFGQAVFLSQIYEAALNVAGVLSVFASTFQRFGQNPAGELSQGYMKFDPLEIAQLANDPNFPENGRLQLTLSGGL